MTGYIKESKLLFLLFIVLALFMFLTAFTDNVSASGKHFPRQILNTPIKPTPDVDKNVKKAEVIYNVSGKEVKGLVVYPDTSSDKVFPAVLFIQTIDETPRDQLARMSSMALGGYFVMCIPWKNTADVEEALQQMIKINMVDSSRVGVVGAHQGGTEAIIMTVKRGDIVKAAVSIAGRPDYEHPTGDPGIFLDAPILLIHGEADTQVHCNVAQYFYYYLTDKGKNADIILMKNSRHYFNDAEWNQIIIDVNRFFDNNLKSFSNSTNIPSK
jgi:predicted peptidase